MPCSKYKIPSARKLHRARVECHGPFQRSLRLLQAWRILRASLVSKDSWRNKMSGAFPGSSRTNLASFCSTQGNGVGAVFSICREKDRGLDRLCQVGKHRRASRCLIVGTAGVESCASPASIRADFGCKPSAFRKNFYSWSDTLWMSSSVPHCEVILFVGASRAACSYSRTAANGFTRLLSRSPRK